jgi:hypothetical protein
MKRVLSWVAVLAIGLVPVAAHADRGLGVEVWTDRGEGAVYEPGSKIRIGTRASDDAYLLLYDIDAEGAVHVLFPVHGQNPYVEGRRSYELPDKNSDGDLVVQGPVGEGYVVALASRTPFEDLPWYLRTPDPEAEGLDYVGKPDQEEDGITPDGKIVGDPFVAMEKIRRRVLHDPEDRDAFATAYTGYYVHEKVRYPRYICYDCHRPNQWSWWDGFDPYYTHCSVFDFRVNYAWNWGPSYWFGFVPCYVYVFRADCPQYYYPQRRYMFSSWDGWRRWDEMWHGRLTRFKTDPPANYVPPTRYKPGGPQGLPAPPGIVTTVERGRAWAPRTPIGRLVDANTTRIPRADWRPGGELRQPPAPVPGEIGAPVTAPGQRPVSPGGGQGEMPRGRGGEAGPDPALGAPRGERPQPGMDPGRTPDPAGQPRNVPPGQPRYVPPSQPGANPGNQPQPHYVPPGRSAPGWLGGT